MAGDRGHGEQEVRRASPCPVDKDLFRYPLAGPVDGFLPNMTARSTWRYATPHNIQRNSLAATSSFASLNVANCGNCRRATVSAALAYRSGTRRQGMAAARLPGGRTGRKRQRGPTHASTSVGLALAGIAGNDRSDGARGKLPGSVHSMARRVGELYLIQGCPAFYEIALLSISRWEGWKPQEYRKRCRSIFSGDTCVSTDSTWRVARFRKRLEEPGRARCRNPRSRGGRRSCPGWRPCRPCRIPRSRPAP